jgi:hypothetical protein
VAGAVHQELRDGGGDAWPKGSRPTRLRGVVSPCEASGAIRLEPGTHGGLVAVEAPGNLRDAPALGIEQDVVTAFGKLRPGPASLFYQGVFFR